LLLTTKKTFTDELETNEAETKRTKTNERTPHASHLAPHQPHALPPSPPDASPPLLSLSPRVPQTDAPTEKESVSPSRRHV